MASSAIRPYSMRRQGDVRWRRNLAVGGVVALLHLGVIIALVRGLAGGIAALPLPHSVLVLLSAPEPAPSPTASARPTPPPPASHTPAGATGAMGRKARPKAIMAPPPRIVLPALQAAPVAGPGDATRSGAGATGTGNGGGVAGGGTGSGAGGNGAGAGLAQRVTKIAGDITATRDYPAAGRADRAGRQVVIVLRVDTQGRPVGCRIQQPSGNDEADAITCRLALQRFRFRPALDAQGQPVEADYGWRQRWWAPGSAP